MKIYFLFLAFILFVSCADLKRPKQLDEIEEIELSLSDAIEQLETIPRDSLEMIIEQTGIVENRIKKYYFGDTVSMSFAIKLELYQKLRPNLINVQKSLSEIDSAVIVRKNQLNVLKNDIQKGAGNRAKYTENILFENKEVERIVNFVKDCDASSSESIKTFDNLQFEIEQFSLKYENDFNAQQKP